MTSFRECIPEKFEKGAKLAAGAFSKLDRVLIATHVNPDGDAVGAAIACACMLKAMGREFVLYAPDGFPRYLDFLEMPGPVCSSLSELPFEPESAVYVDCSDGKRLGPELMPVAATWPSVNIDHHLCDSGLGTLANFIDHSAGAACQLVAYVAMSLGLPLQGELGEAIAVGLLTDTGQFAHGNTNANIFALCSELEINGCSFAGIAEKLHNVWTLRRLHIWGKCFLGIKLAMHGKIAWCLLTRGEILDAGVGRDDMEGFIDMLRRIEGVEIAIFGREQENGQTRFSLRSRGRVSVQEIALAFGGGGHRNAAGVTVNAPAVEAMNIVLAACEAELQGMSAE